MKQNEQQKYSQFYQEMLPAFEMTPQQMRSVEQRIRARARQDEAAFTATGISKHSFRFGKLLPLAACLMLLFGGVLAVSVALSNQDTFNISENSVPIEEITEMTTLVPAETDTDDALVTTVMTVLTETTARTQGTQTTAQTSVTQHTAGTTASGTTAAAANRQQAASQTAGTTASASETAAPRTASTTRPAVTTQEPATARTSPTTRTTTATTAPVTTTEPIVTTETTANTLVVLRMGNYTAAPGETVTIEWVVERDVSLNGLQFYFGIPDGYDLYQLRNDPELYSDLSVSNINKEVDVQTNSTEDLIPFRTISLVFAQANPIDIPAGTVLLRMSIKIPETTEPGTVYRFETAPNSNDISNPDDPHNKAINDIEYPMNVVCGTITVTG